MREKERERTVIHHNPRYQMNRKLKTSLTGSSFHRRKQNNSWDLENETYPFRGLVWRLRLEHVYIYVVLLELGPELTASAWTLSSSLTFTLIIIISTLKERGVRVSISSSLLPTCSLLHHLITTLGSPFNDVVHFRFSFCRIVYSIGLPYLCASSLITIPVHTLLRL